MCAVEASQDPKIIAKTLEVGVDSEAGGFNDHRF